jgi:two-component system, sensor histidine kinase YesM
MRERRLLQFHSIHSQLALAFSVLILCTTAILSFTAYRLSSDSVKTQSLEYTNELVKQVRTNIETYIQNMESISSLSLGNGDLKRYASLTDKDSPEAEGLARQVGDYFSSIVSSRGDIASILYVGPHGGIVSDGGHGEIKEIARIKEQDWYTHAIRLSGQAAISSAHVQQLFTEEYRWVVSLSRQMMQTAGKGEGVLLVDLNYTLIDNLCKQIQLGKRGYVFILDPAGDLVYHPQQQIINTQLKSEEIPAILASEDGSWVAEADGGQKIYTVSTTPFGWKIVGVIYAEDLAGNKRAMQGSAAFWGSLCLAVALTISVIFTFTLTRPLKTLELHMKRVVEKGDFDQRVAIDSPNEIGMLARTFNLMIMKIKDLMAQIVQEQESKRISDLKALQAQIQPHFLYNTLDSIIWMAEMGKMDEVVRMTSAFAKLLRASISEGDELVPIAVELNHIRNYLTIQQMRYRSKFSYSIEVPEELQKLKILRLVLQPLVENAIYHGMKHKPETGHIRITGRRISGMIELIVADDGVGMPPEKLHAIIARLQSQNDAHSSSGVGVQNVNHRIALYFGPAFGLRYESELEEGTTVFVRIPELGDGEEG